MRNSIAHNRNLFLLIPLIFCLAACEKNKPAPAIPELSVSYINPVEGDSGESPLQVNFSLSSASLSPVNFSYATRDSTAIAGKDYVAVNNSSLEFKPGETLKSITLQIIGDTIMEFTESFDLVISNLENATISDNPLIINITDNDVIYTIKKEDGIDIPDSYPGMTLKWSDEFNGTGLNIASWNYETGGGGWGNHESEVYTSDTANVHVENGKLVIKAIGNSGNYTSSRLTTQGKEEFKFGLIDIRAKLPDGQGLWPALWMLGSDIDQVNWPACGEIDIMELIGKQPGTVYGTAHWDNNGNQSDGNSYTLEGNSEFSDEYHVFSLLWEPGRMVWYVDYKKYFEITKSANGYNWPFDAPFFFIFNVAVGGDWPGPPDETTVFPQMMNVDFVRVYESN